jgi:hypothetical protein
LAEDLRTLLERALEKDPRRRLRDIGEARVTLEDLHSGKRRMTAVESIQRDPSVTLGAPTPVVRPSNALA